MHRFNSTRFDKPSIYDLHHKHKVLEEYRLVKEYAETRFYTEITTTPEDEIITQELVSSKRQSDIDV